MEVNVGDVVQLKSGGKKMTVEQIDSGYATCVFTDEFDDIKRQELNVAVLRVLE